METTPRSVHGARGASRGARLKTGGAMAEKLLANPPLCWDSPRGLQLLPEWAEEHPELQRAAARFQALAGSTLPVAMQGLDRNGVVHLWSESSARLYGMPAEAAMGRRLQELLLPEDQWDRFEALLAAIWSVQRGEPPCEWPVAARSGPLWVLTTMFPVVEGGRVVEVIRMDVDVTARKQAETELAHERFLLHALMDNIPDAIYFKDVESRFVRINAAQARTLGASSPEEAVGRTDMDYQVPEIAAESLRDERHVPGTGRPLVAKAEPVRTHDGRAKWVSTTKVPLRDSGGTITGLVGISRDITELRVAEEQLRSRVEEDRRLLDRLRALHQVSNRLSLCASVDDMCREAVTAATSVLGFERVGIWLWDRESQTLVGTFGTDEDGRVRDERGTRRELHEPSDTRMALEAHEPWVRALDRELHDATGTVVGRGSWGAAPMWDGQDTIGVVCTDTLFSSRALQDTDCEVLALLAAAIGHHTTRLRVQERLQESEQRHRVLAEQSFLGICIVQDDRVSFANRAFADLAGCSPEALRTLTVSDLVAMVHPDDRESVARQYRRKTSGDPCAAPHFTYRIVRDGRVRWVEQYSQAIMLSGRPADFLTTADITDRVEAEQERRRLETRLQDAEKNESLAVLAGGVAHDFNNLLVGVLGHASLALISLDADAAVRPYIEQIEAAATRAAELANQMLAYSGRGRFQLQPIDLSELVSDMMPLLEASVSHKCVLRGDLACGLPPVDGDPTQLRQIVLNLVKNASDAIDRGSGLVTIETGTRSVAAGELTEDLLGDGLPTTPCVFLRVTDTGHGMDEATQRRVFEPFFTTKFTGRGLGLAAVLGIVRGHGGAIGLTSRPGEGTTFEVLLPASRREPREASPAPTTAPALAEPAATGCVLVVDDEEDVRLVARAALEFAGFTVLTANNGREGLAIFREQSDRICAVLLDLTMPEMGGAETLPELRRVRPDARVVISTGYGEDETLERLGHVPPTGFIQKPYGAPDLIAKIRSVIAP